MWNKGPKLTDEEIVFVKQLFAKEQARRERAAQLKALSSAETKAIPASTLYPGVALQQSTIAILQEKGARVFWIDEAHGHGVIPPKGRTRLPFVQIMQDLEPNSMYAKDYRSYLIRHNMAG